MTGPDRPGDHVPDLEWVRRTDFADESARRPRPAAGAGARHPAVSLGRERIAAALAAARADEKARRERLVADLRALADRLETSYRRLPEDAGATLAAELLRAVLDADRD